MSKGFALIVFAAAVNAVDWNGDGDIDILTGQGHGGSNLRFFERDWIEDQMNGTHPGVRIQGVDTKSALRYRRKP